MANKAYLRFILKTPNGYLTTTGITQNINETQIIVMNIFETGGLLASKKVQVENFLKKSAAKLNFAIDDYEVISYTCPLDRYHSCCDCMNRKDCVFWTQRETCKFN